MIAPLKIPVTASDKGEAEWKRRTATAVNQSLGTVDKLAVRTSALETFQTTITPEVADLESRMANAEGFIADPEAAYFVFTPGTLPGSPAHGMVATDIADGKLKFYDGTIWNALY